MLRFPGVELCAPSHVKCHINYFALRQNYAPVLAAASRWPNRYPDIEISAGVRCPIWQLDQLATDCIRASDRKMTPALASPRLWQPLAMLHLVAHFASWRHGEIANSRRKSSVTQAKSSGVSEKVPDRPQMKLRRIKFSVRLSSCAISTPLEWCQERLGTATGLLPFIALFRSDPAPSASLPSRLSMP